MTIKTTSLAAFGAALIAVSASGAVAQGTTTTTDPALSTDTTVPMDDNDDDSGKLGLLGLLGLAGLLGLKKRDNNDHRHTNNTTGTGTGTGTGTR